MYMYHSISHMILAHTFTSPIKITFSIHIHIGMITNFKYFYVVYNAYLLFYFGFALTNI